MDVWLDSQGLYRKNTALDGTCLFRAVADQLFTYHVPNGHVVLREECVKFMRENRHLFESKVISGPFDEYLDNLSDLKQWAGQMELEALSLIYGVDFLVFKSIDLAPIPATQNGFERKIMLCFTPDNFYDAVYPKSYIENAGFCQSIVYGILYSGVFKLEDLEYAVEKMLHDKSARARREKYLNSQSQGREDSLIEIYLEESAHGTVNVRELLDKGAILFPYKVAKALDPEIYRNIDFDNWVDTLRVPRKNSFCFGNGGPLRVGVKCLLKLEDKTHTAHVQEMSPNNGPVVVFVEDIGEKMTVPYESLEPLPRTSLKPEWTFSHKHQIINKFRELNVQDDANKGKQQMKNKGKKNKFMGGMEKRGMEPPGAHDLAEQNRQGNENRNESGTSSGSGSTVLAEPDSTTTSYAVSPVASPTQLYYSSNFLCTQYGWTNASAHPQFMKTINLAANRSVKNDLSDLPLNDLETMRFFYNLGVDYFRMGVVFWAPAAIGDDNETGRQLHQPPPPAAQMVSAGAVASGPTGAWAMPKSPEETPKLKNPKHMKKPPRFLKMESADAKTGEKPRSNYEEPINYQNELVPEQQQYQHQHHHQPHSPMIQPGLQQPMQQPQALPPTQQQQAQGPLTPGQIPLTVPYPYAVQYPIPNVPYPVQGYPVQQVQPMPEPMPVEAQPIPAVGYSDQQYVEAPYTMPYYVYAQPQFYYPN